MPNWTAQDMPDLTGKITIVTGANSGIGYETAKALAAKNATVVMACRNPDKARAAADAIRGEVPGARLDPIPLDLADLASVERFADAFQARYDRLDILVNNAGVMVPPFTETADGFEVQFGANHLGHFALTGRLLDVIARTESVRVVTVSSGAHRMGSGTIDFDDLNAEKGYRPTAAYAQSKLANLLFTRGLNRRFREADIDAVATAAHPGWTATNLQTHSRLFSFLNPFFSQRPPMGALPTLYAATEALEPNAYAGPKGRMEMRGYPTLVDTSDAAKDEALAERLWEVSERMTGVRYGLGRSVAA
jgi:NAD(P)-dependent dehydrogenase (short-subunit alcohol dehydrogenase family)